MKRLLIYWIAFLRGYRGPNEILPRRSITTELGRAEWWGLADGCAFRNRITPHPFCRQCGYQILFVSRFDPNLGGLCKQCGYDRDVEVGRKLLE